MVHVTHNRRIVMKLKFVFLIVAVYVGLCVWPALNAEASPGGDPPANCVIPKSNINPASANFSGTIVVSADLDTGMADVILRLGRANEVHFFRTQYTGVFSPPTLQGDQGRLCAIVNNPTNRNSILAAFNLQGSSIVTTPDGIRNTELSPLVATCDEDPKQLECKIPGIQFVVDPDTAFLNPYNLHHGIVISDVILYVQ
jgi:hypothetical protein